MYVLSRVITGLGASPAAATGIGNIAAAITAPALLNKLRRLKYLSFCIEFPSVIISESMVPKTAAYNPQDGFVPCHLSELPSKPIEVILELPEKRTALFMSR